MSVIDHQRYIQRALELARLGSGTAAPNPMVGGVLVHNGVIIGEGWHRQWGEPHAEVNCIENVPSHLKQLIPESTMYVTLEPCAHWGKQPPCANRIVQEGIKKVVVCNDDPFAKVNGQGYQILKDAGIEVHRSIIAENGRWLNRRFFTYHQQQRPYIILKWAQSADSYIAPPDGSRTNISNHFSHVLSHKWRTEEAAIIVGYNTALNDDPQLTARHWKGPQPLRIALDRNLRLPNTHYLFQHTAPTWILNDVEDRVDGSISYIKSPFSEVLLPFLLQKLHAAQKLSLIVEGGSTLLQSLIDAGLWDEARIFKTQVQLGNGISAPSLTHASLQSASPITTDTLELWLHKNSSYAYPTGAEL